LENNQFIPAKFTCDGEDLNPSLIIEEVPEETKRLTLEANGRIDCLPQ
jgi:phosphatidylethanolamine-binding protein (PEBP) family uncharacterized protein